MPNKEKTASGVKNAPEPASKSLRGGIEKRQTMTTKTPNNAQNMGQLNLPLTS